MYGFMSWNDPKSKSICIDLSKVEGDQPLYKVTYFVTTGVIQAQGHNRDSFLAHDFPALKQLVKEKCMGS